MAVVRFDPVPIRWYYFKSSDNSPDVLQESRDRQRVENAALHGKDPSTYLDMALVLFQTCLQKDINIVFGNLGRHPLLLNYLLDLGFTANEKVGISIPWDVDCPYRVQAPYPDLDVLFIVEPYFGFNLLKPNNVHHVVVLTSHFALQFPQQSCQVIHFQVGDIPTRCRISDRLVTQKSWEPPIFHDGKVNQFSPKGHIHLDVTQARSAHEAYLRLLTGREMTQHRYISISISPRDQQVIRVHIERSKERVHELGWNESWIHEGYFNQFEDTGPTLVIQKPIRGGQGE